MAYITGPVDSNRVTLRITSDHPTASCADVEKFSAATTPQLQMRIWYWAHGGSVATTIIKVPRDRRFDDLTFALQYAPTTGTPLDLKGTATFTKAPRTSGELAHLTLDVSDDAGRSWKGETDALVCAFGQQAPSP